MARILIIEDNLANTDLMAFLLGAHGHEPFSAANGARGLALARAERPDLIACDVHLPDMDGCAVVAALKAEPELAAIPVLAVTALTMQSDRDRLLEAGFDGYVGKPIEPDSFAAELEAFLPPAQPPLLLLVDDDPFMLGVLDDFLGEEGYRVLTARSGQEALDLLERHPVRLILSDQCMPGMRGTELMALSAARHPGAARMILSGQAEQGEIARALDDGLIDQFLTKPWNGAELRERIDAALRRRAAR